MSENKPTLLSYEKQALMDLLTEDCLVVLAEGILYHNILLSYLDSFSNPGTLVLVVDCEDVLEEWLLEKLTISESTVVPPKKVTSELHVEKRMDHYLQGGVQFISKRILVIDLLCKRIPVDLITGIIFFNAHYVRDTSIESFITRLFRTDNKTGFLKAFSSSPIQLNKFNQAEKCMRHLFLPRIHLWPRFHANISECIDKHKCEVIELHIPLTDIMKNLQICIIDLLHFCMKEVKKHIPSLDSDFFVVENAVAKDYFRSLKKVLNPMWSHLGSNTKQLVEDIKTISRLNNQLLQCSAVRFYEVVHKLKPTGASRSSRVCLWMFTEAFGRLLSLSKQRVEQRDAEKIELSPKWEAIQEILAEIKSENKGQASKNTLFCVSSNATARQIVRFIKYGEVSTLAEELLSTQKHQGVETEETNEQEQGLEASHNIYFLVENRYTMINEHLNSLNPTYVILYDPDLFMVRSLEMFRCRRPGKPLRIYFLVYDNSIEEQRYLTQLSEEKKAFEQLIMMKGNMTVYTDQDGKEGTNAMLERGKQGLKFKDLESQDSRQNKVKSFPKVIVDMRDFRSSLPSILHKSGIDLVPKTIEIGDYILTPDICIERKSIMDLIGSLSSGRLFQQCQSMCNTYKHPMLLIEFDEANGFSLQNYSSVSDSVVTTSLQTQLTLITLHFPKLRMIWSQSEYTTANIFHELKKGKDDPDVATIEGISKESSITTSEFNHSAVNSLLQLPGITSKNYFLLARKFQSLLEVSAASKETLSEVLENKEEGRALFEFFNQVESKNKPDEKVTGAKSKYAKFKKFRKK
ncbi:DNA repair endonuclease XPF-like [Bolinopsis microptera]|uniref:DNA repair endonuclease XPF-like n=1 Tax=Bolinopsis microptera TaxID=2820187 RepID=UPI00307A1BAC